MFSLMKKKSVHTVAIHCSITYFELATNESKHDKPPMADGLALETITDRE
jgi:hypothetical protein